MFIALFSCGQIIGFFIMPSTSNWMVNLVPDRIRGRYLGIKEGASLLTMAAVSVSMALVIDHMKLMGQEMWGYAICSVTILTLTIVDFLCFFHAGEPPSPLGQKKVSLKTMLTVPFQDKAFRKVIGLSILFNFGMQIGGPYFGVYFYSVLGLDYTYIMLVNIAFYLIRTTAAQIWGRVADKKSWAFISKCSLAWLGIVHAAFMLLNGGNMYYMFPALQVIAGVGWGGVAISMFNMQFEYAPRENRTVYIAANAAVSSVSGFSAVLVGSLIVNLVGGKVWQIFNVPVVGMQRLFILSGGLLVLTAVYIHKVIQPRSKQDVAE